jgi:MFS family permease
VTSSEAVSSRATLRAMLLPAFVPTMVFETGSGATLPIIAVSALHLGASAAEASLLLALTGVGRVLGDVPAASLARRLGDRLAMVVASAVSVVAFAVCALARDLLVLGGALLVVGGATAVFYLARHSYLVVASPVLLRARVMSTLAGSHRVGLFLGPFVGAAVISLTDVRGGYVVAAAASALAGVVLLCVRDLPPASPVDAGEAPVPARAGGSWSVVKRYRRLFLTLGLGILAVGAVRAARQTVLPLWAEHLDLSAEVISLVFGVAGAAEILLFYPAGRIMDLYGRLAVAVPAMVVLGASMMFLPLTTGVVGVMVVAVVMSIGNGIGSGIMMTLGADAAPADERVRFLGVWRLVSDSGSALGPAFVAAVTSLAALWVAIVAVGSTGLLAAAALGRWTSRYSPFATPSAVRAYLEDR